MMLLPSDNTSQASGTLETADAPAAAAIGEAEPQSVTLEDIADTSWRLVSYGERSALIDAIADVDVTAEFSSDGALNGYAGCNRYFTDFQIEDGLISIGPAGMTRMMCADNALQDQEFAFAAALERMIEPRLIMLNDTDLEIDLGDDQVLILELLELSLIHI